MKFKVLQGSHIQNGKTYDQGKTVTSDVDLTKLFPGKFESVADPADKASAPARVAPVAPVEEEEADGIEEDVEVAPEVEVQSKARGRSGKQRNRNK